MHKAAGEDVFYEMEEALIKRILPHSIEAEQSVIGSMILDRDAILVASEILTSDDFYSMVLFLMPWWSYVMKESRWI